MAAMSGISVHQEIVDIFNQDMKLGKKHAYIICKIKNKPEGQKGSEVRLDATSDAHPKDCDHEQCKVSFNLLKETLKDDEPCYIIYDFRFKSADGRDTDKLGFIFWNADSGNVKKKMVYSSTKEAVSKKLQLGKCFQVSDKDDMDFEEMVKELRKLK